MSRAAVRWLLLWAGWISGLWWAAGPAWAQAACTEVQGLTRAERTVLHRDGRVLSQGPVTLMDSLVPAWRSEHIVLRYRLSLPSCQSADAPALWVFRVGAPYRIQIDGRPLQPLSPLAAAADATYNGRIPALFAVPRAGGTLELELLGPTYIPAGLVRLDHGPLSALQPRIQVEQLALTGANNVFSAIILMAGLLAGMTWLQRRHDRPLLWFGLACVAWAARGLAYQAFALPVWPLLVEQINPYLVLLTMACMGASTLYTLGHMTRHRAQALLGTVAGVTLLMALTLALGHGALLARAAAFGLAFLMLTGLVLALARALPSREPRLLVMLVGYLALFLGALHDIGMVLGWASPDHWSFITLGFTVMLLCHALAVSQYLVRSLNRAERANEELEQRVQEKTAQLESSYALLRASERESARAQEREHLLREMHDGLGAQLITALRGVERGAMAREQVMQALQEGLDDLRLLMDSSDMGRELSGALALWRHRWAPRLSTLNIALDWDIDDALETLSLGSDVVLQIMRILQEATANVVKHANAQRVVLQVRIQPAATAGQVLLQLCLEDDGVGMADHDGRSGRLPRADARGLNNMRHRARLIGASLQVDARSGAQPGTVVWLRLPVTLSAASSHPPESGGGF